MTQQKSLERAFMALKARTTAIAVVYGYSRHGIYHDDCIVIYDYTKLKEFQKLLSSKKNGRIDTTVYTLFRNQLPE